MSRARVTVFEFEGFKLNTINRLLFRGDHPVSLPPKAFDILCFLIEHRDRVVTKAELLKAVWPDTFVEEGNLAQNVSVIRRALGEAPSEHKFIVTIPGRGYRFAAAVRDVAPGSGIASPESWFVKGRHLLNKRLTGTLREAITCFLQSIDEDPAFAPAWAGLADAYALLSLYGASLPREVFPKSKAAALEAYTSTRNWRTPTTRLEWWPCSTTGTGRRQRPPSAARSNSIPDSVTRISDTVST
jgi:DNA-binding winged helix-turn-helix (wHTH) protein